MTSAYYTTDHDWKPADYGRHQCSRCEMYAWRQPFTGRYAYNPSAGTSNYDLPCDVVIKNREIAKKKKEVTDKIWQELKDSGALIPAKIIISPRSING